MKMKTMFNLCLISTALIGLNAFAADKPPVNTVTTTCVIPADAQENLPATNQGFVCCGQPQPNGAAPTQVGWYPIVNAQAPLVCPPPLANSTEAALKPMVNCLVTPEHNPAVDVYAPDQSTNKWIPVLKKATNYPTACSKVVLAQTAPPAP